MWGSRPLRRFGLSGCGALAILIATAAPAAAHAALVGTSPSQSAHYPADAPPSTVTVAFDDDVTSSANSIEAPLGSSLIEALAKTL